MKLAHDWFDRDLPEQIAIGEGSWLYSSFSMLHFASRRRHALSLGRYSGVYDGCHFELGPNGRVTIGDYCAIVGAIINTDRHVWIGNFVFIAHEVVIADTAFARPWEDDAGNSGEADPTRPGMSIGDNAWIGARAVMLGHCRIGESAVIGAATVVTADVPAFAVAAGNPMRIVGDVRDLA